MNRDMLKLPVAKSLRVGRVLATVFVPSFGVIFMLVAFVGLFVLPIIVALVRLVFAANRQMAFEAGSGRFFLILLALIFFAVQFSKWLQARSEFTRFENLVVLTVFAIYAAAAFGCVRYALDRHAIGSYRLASPEADARKLAQAVHLKMVASAAEQQIRFLSAVEAGLSRPCSVHIAASWADYYGSVRARRWRALPTRGWIENGGKATAPCDVWIFKASHHLKEWPLAFAEPSLGRANYRILLRKYGNAHLFFLKHAGQEVRLVVGEHDMSGVSPDVETIVTRAYDAPRMRKNLTEILVRCIAWERQRQVTAVRDAALLNMPGGRPTLGLPRFVLYTISDYVGSESDLVPASTAARLLDISFHILRLFFAAVFVDLLAGTKAVTAA